VNTQGVDGKHTFNDAGSGTCVALAIFVFAAETGAVCQQHFGDFRMAKLACFMEGRLAIVVFAAHTGTVCQQHFGDFRMALEACFMEGR